jgi:hypothetical protein
VSKLRLLAFIKLKSVRKSPWKLSPTRKANQRKRLKQVDAVIETVRQSGVECGALVGSLHDDEKLSDWNGIQATALELPTEAQMPAKDKYSVFSRHHTGYRKGVHKVPKFTRVSPDLQLLFFTQIRPRLLKELIPEDFNTVILYSLSIA